MVVRNGAFSFHLCRIFDSLICGDLVFVISGSRYRT